MIVLWMILKNSKLKLRKRNCSENRLCGSKIHIKDNNMGNPHAISSLQSSQCHVTLNPYILNFFWHQLALAGLNWPQLASTGLNWCLLGVFRIELIFSGNGLQRMKCLYRVKMTVIPLVSWWQLRPAEASWGNLRPDEAIWGQLRQFEASWGNLRPLSELCI